MKFNIPGKALYNFVSAVSKVINAKNAVTILNSFLFCLEGNRLRVVACDMENTLVGYIDVMEVEGEGSFCIDAQRVIGLLKEIPDQGIQFSVNDSTLEVEIEYTLGSFKVMATDGNEYPYDAQKGMDNEELVATFQAPTGAVLRAIESTIFAVGHDDLRPQMNGIYWDIAEDSATFVATDSKQLVKYVNHTIKPGVKTSFVLPTKPCTVLRNVFTGEGSIKVSIYERCVVFENSQFNFTCSMLKSRYPDYNRVIPKNTAYTLTLACDDFLQALKRVSIFSGGQGLVKFKILPDQVRMRTDDSGACGNALEMVPCSFTGSEMLIGFSFPVLMNMFQAIKCDEGVMKLTDPGRAALIEPAVNEEGTELVMLTMPMSVNDFPEE